ncbi:Alpha/beta hydrolase family protein [Aquisphaera giovannonii]|uniref:Alpha/beta hydrolase family protein n=1 Tax=Aquisphaera giovannonii TaxID=406548 RepID=A0A5B9WAK9_9BACT|nr:dienelactone hydrolase family protein [Aquisphaera giovannonii]QEH37543.1 Alpha/beta hydrolase family protein [Aquisphaera giovannonii]
MMPPRRRLVQAAIAASILMARLARAAQLLAPLKARETRPGLQSFGIKAAGATWNCVAHLPAKDPGRPLPVVLVLHGSGGDGASMLERCRWLRKADEAGFLAVAPDSLPLDPGRGADFLTNPRMWNAGQLDPGTPRAKVDDVAFFRALLDELPRLYRIDESRIYVTGHSNGAGMTFRLATELSDRIAAIAAVGSICWVKNPRIRNPMPTFFLTGMSDPLVPVRGGISVLPWGKRTTPPVSDTLDAWARALGCPSRPRVTEHRDTGMYFEYGPGRGGSLLAAHLIDGQGHNWPGGRSIVPGFLGPDNRRVDATDMIWEFLRRYRNRGGEKRTRDRDGRTLEEALMRGR